MVVLLGLGTVGFGVLSVTFSSQASKTKASLEEAKTKAADEAREAQKKADEENFTKLSNSPYRAYVAPEAYGSFVVNFPKLWSAKVVQQNSGTQIDLALNPDFISTINNVPKPLAAHVQLIQSSKDNFLKSYAGDITRGKIKQTNITVSGLPAFDLAGTFTSKLVIRMVVVPVRDKVIVYSIENNAYMAEFNQILAQTKIVP